MQKPFSQLAAVMALFTVLALSPGAMAASKDYTLVCNGRSMTAAFALHHPMFRGKPTIQVAFGKARNAASRQQPGPGQCAWVDRPLTASEPAIFYFRNAGNPVTRITVTTGETSAALYPVRLARQIPHGGLQSRAAQPIVLLDAIHRGQLFYIQAHTEQVRGRDVLIMTRFGP